MVFAVSTQVFENDILSEAHLVLFKECGFVNIEIFLTRPHFDWHDSNYVKAIQRIITRLGLSVCSVHAPWMPGADISSLDSQVRNTSVRDVKRAVDLLQLLGGQVVVIHPGAAMDQADDVALKRSKSRESLLDVARYCRTKGVQIALENPPRYELCGEVEDLLGLYQSLTQSDISACFDTGHANICGGPYLWRLTPQEKIHIHLHDNDGINDSHLSPGSGSFEWEVFLKLLKASAFEGVVCLELSPNPDTGAILRASKTWFETMKQKYNIR